MRPDPGACGSVAETHAPNMSCVCWALCVQCSRERPSHRQCIAVAGGKQGHDDPPRSLAAAHHSEARSRLCLHHGWSSPAIFYLSSHFLAIFYRPHTRSVRTHNTLRKHTPRTFCIHAFVYVCTAIAGRVRAATAWIRRGVGLGRPSRLTPCAQPSGVPFMHSLILSTPGAQSQEEWLHRLPLDNPAPHRLVGGGETPNGMGTSDCLRNLHLPSLHNYRHSTLPTTVTAH